MTRLKIVNLVAKAKENMAAPDRHQVSFMFTRKETKTEPRYHSRTACYGGVRHLDLKAEFEQSLNFIAEQTEEEQEMLKEIVDLHAEHHNVKLIKEGQDQFVYVGGIKDWQIDDYGLFMMTLRNITEHSYGIAYKVFREKGLSKRVSALLATVLRVNVFNDLPVALNIAAVGHSWTSAITASNFRELQFSGYLKDGLGLYLPRKRGLLPERGGGIWAVDDAMSSLSHVGTPARTLLGVVLKRKPTEKVGSASTVLIWMNLSRNYAKKGLNNVENLCCGRVLHGTSDVPDDGL